MWKVYAPTSSLPGLLNLVVCLLKGSKVEARIFSNESEFIFPFFVFPLLDTIPDKSCGVFEVMSFRVSSPKGSLILII